MKNIFSLKLIPIFLLIFLCIPVVLPFFKTGYFPTHDGEWAVVRLADMFRTLRDFQFPARYSGPLNFGYGYPLFNFAYPFPYYFGILFYVFSHSFIFSIKIMFVLSVFLSAIFMYLVSFKLWKNKLSGIVSAVLYIYLPYRMVDLYVRGSIGESLSLALFPLILFFALRLFESTNEKINIFTLSLLIGILIMTHNIMTVLFMPVLIIFILIRIITEKRFDTLKTFFVSVFLGLGISAFFWFPALFEKSFILLSKIPIADRNLYFANLNQLLIPSWGYAPPTESGGFSYQLGISQLVVVIISLAFLCLRFLKTRFIQTPAIKYVLTLTLVWILCFLMLFSFTSPIWKSLPLLKEINYPWTLLSQLGFISSLLGGFLVLQGKLSRYLLVVLSILAIFLVYPYAKPSQTVNFSDNYYMTNEDTTTSSDEYMPLWVVDYPNTRFKDKVEVIKGSAIISDLFYKSNIITFNYKADEDSIIRINTIYYPGWKIYLDNKNIEEKHNNPKGVMEISVPKYGREIKIIFHETISRMIVNIISILSLILMMFILYRSISINKTK